MILLVVVFVDRVQGSDCNGNGVEDLQETAEGDADDCNLNSIPDECELAPLPLRSREAIRTEMSPTAYTSGDLDGDGYPELVFVDRRSLNIGRYLGGGELDLQTYVIPAFSFGVALGDFDDDGRKDVVVESNGRPLIYFNTGGGLLRDPIEIGSRDTSIVTAGDVTGDGIDDLIVGLRVARGVRILPNLGAGLFGEPIDIDLPQDPDAIRLVDLNGDGRLDIAGIVPTGRRLPYVIWNDGGAGFRVEILARIDAFGRDWFELVAADLDDDGFGDLVGTNGTEIFSARGGPDGVGDAVRFSTFALAGGSLGPYLAVGDVDADGHLDVVTGARLNSILLVARGAGDGTFATASLLDSATSEGVPVDIEFLDAGDYDADGDDDIVVVPRRTRELLFVWSDRRSRMPRGSSGGLLSFTRTEIPTTNWEPHSSVLDDFDGDGDPDIASIDGEDFVHILFNTPESPFREEISLRLEGASEMIWVTAGDLDQDGDPDLAFVDEATGRVFVVFVDEGPRLRQSEQRFDAGERPVHVVIDDLGEDGTNDLICAVQGSGRVATYLNDGTGRFEAGPRLNGGVGPVSVATGDFDGDGDTDIVAADSQGGELRFFDSDGEGGFASVRRLDTTTPAFVHAMDLDGDLDLDLAVATNRQRRVDLFENPGNGEFRFLASVDLGREPFSVTSGDIDGDGAPDIVASSPSSNHVSVVINDRAEFSLVEHIPVGRDPRFSTVGDVDGDGDNDIISCDHTSLAFSLLENHTPRRVSSDSHRELICTVEDFYSVSIPFSGEGEVEWLTKYIVPADADDPDLLPPLFQNTRRYPLHQTFLAEVFPEAIPPASYDAFVNRRATRRYWVGVVYLLLSEDGPLFGFNVLSAFVADRSELPRQEEVAYVHGVLSERFTIAELAYFPDETATREDAADWENPGFPIYLRGLAADRDFEAYTEGVGYGRVRVLTPLEVIIANANGQLGFQDIVVFEEPPRDIEGVVAAVLTEQPQGPLSHLAVRSARRGTPNAYIAEASDVFEAMEGELVRIEVTAAGYKVERGVELADAEAWWESIRPEVPPLTPADTEHAGLDRLREIAALLDDDIRPVARYGGKSTNMARLYTVLTGEHEQRRESGFVVPMRYYVEFLRSNRLPSAVDPAREVTYAEFISEILDWDEFRSDSRLRFQTLAELRRHMEEESEVDPQLVERAADRVVDVFGSATNRVRFRSSSNAEDMLEFNGAGLYSSTSACAADDLDDDDDGPSACDEGRDDERGIADALRTVWASLWNFRAFEEREYFGISQSGSAMAVYVSRAFVDERLNGVAFTGNPTSFGDDRYLVTAQVGEESVVSPDPSVLPETTLLSIRNGEVTEILRVQPSSLLPAGGHVVSDERLRELGDLLAFVDNRFPLDLGNHPREDVLLDFEFKVDVDGELAIKQVRPFLRALPSFPRPTFELSVDEGAMFCGVFVETRPLDRALELKSRVRLRGGRFELSTRRDSFPFDLIESVEVGGEGEFATPVGGGRFEVSRLADGEETHFRFRFVQEFTLPDGLAFTLQLSNLVFRSRGPEPVEASVDLVEAVEDGEVDLVGNVGFVIEYGACDYERLPLWSIDVELEDGASIHLLERHEPPPTPNDTGPAALTYARIELRGVVREVTEYWGLVYASLRHNTAVEHLIAFDPPLDLGDGSPAIRDAVVIAPEPGLGIEAAVELRVDGAAQPLPLTVISYRRSPVDRVFRRGDAFSDGEVNISDAVFILNHLFLQGDTPGCRDAADTDDDGVILLTDAVRLLSHLFTQGAPLPEPFKSCGADATDDTLDCMSHPPCS